VCHTFNIVALSLSKGALLQRRRLRQAQPDTVLKFATILTMTRVAFKMQLHKGLEEEYRKRHATLWPELEQLLKETGISEYSIFLDETTNSLFGVLKATDPAALDNLPAQPVMKKWWAYMKDIMDSNPDNSPVSIPLKEVFYLP
jgi:L-rhamnose mutarotase